MTENALGKSKIGSAATKNRLFDTGRCCKPQRIFIPRINPPCKRCSEAGAKRRETLPGRCLGDPSLVRRRACRRRIRRRFAAHRAQPIQRVEAVAHHLIHARGPCAVARKVVLIAHHALAWSECTHGCVGSFWGTDLARHQNTAQDSTEDYAQRTDF